MTLAATTPISALSTIAATDTRPRRIIHVVGDDAPHLSSTLAWLSDLLGINLRLGKGDPTGPTIEYSQQQGKSGGLWIPRKRYCLDTLPPLTPADIPDVRDNAFTFDLFDAIRFWLSDEPHANAPAGAFDAHGRLRGNASIFAQHGLPAIPIVNHYVNALRNAIASAFSIQARPLWPVGKRACVVLTHDVDAPLDPDAPATRRHLERLQGASRICRFRSTLRDTLQRSSRKANASPRRHWLFDEIMQAESRHGFRSTFFYAARHCGMPGACAQHDVRYDIAAPAFRSVFSAMRDRGFEIGLHASYNAHQNHAMFAEERDRLQRYAGITPQGVRHHYWRLGRPLWPTLRAHSDAGLTYDASLAYNESPGFRFGVALPFRPLGPKAAKPIETLQIPTMLMDGAVFYHEGATATDGIRTAEEWIDHLVAAGGCGAIDWHVRTSYPGSRRFGEWGRAYLAILDRLAERDDIFVTSCAGLIDHLQARRS